MSQALALTWVGVHGPFLSDRLKGVEISYTDPVVYAWAKSEFYVEVRAKINAYSSRKDGEFEMVWTILPEYREAWKEWKETKEASESDDDFWDGRVNFKAIEAEEVKRKGADTLYAVHYYTNDGYTTKVVRARHQGEAELWMELQPDYKHEAGAIVQQPTPAGDVTWSNHLEEKYDELKHKTETMNRRRDLLQVIFCADADTIHEALKSVLQKEKNEAVRGGDQL